MTQPKTTTALVKVSVNSPQSMANFANQLKAFIVSKDLYTKIKDKNFVHVEAWEFAGACMGIVPVLEWAKKIEASDSEIKYHARVVLKLLSSGKIVGAGEAVCSSKESSKKGFDEYAISSMAQTRATSKAFRLSFGWIMKMAGYEATSAEEMEPAPTALPEVVEAIEIVKKRVTDKLDSMSTPDRIRTIKKTRKLDLKKLTDTDWRWLDTELQN